MRMDRLFGRFGWGVFVKVTVAIEMFAGVSPRSAASAEAKTVCTAAVQAPWRTLSIRICAATECVTTATSTASGSNPGTTCTTPS